MCELLHKRYLGSIVQYHWEDAICSTLMIVELGFVYSLVVGMSVFGQQAFFSLRSIYG